MALRDKLVYGDMRPPTGQTVPIFILNSKLVGGAHIPTGDDGVVNCASSNRTGSAARVTLVDCEIAPRRPAIGRDGIRGRAFECAPLQHSQCGGRHRHLRHHPAGHGQCGCDGEGQLDPQPVRYTYPDTRTPSHTDGTHNDCIQHQGGRNVQIIGNSLHGTTTAADVTPGSGTNPQDPWLVPNGWATGSCLIIQNNTGQGVDLTTVADKNWFKAGKVPPEYQAQHHVPLPGQQALP